MINFRLDIVKGVINELKNKYINGIRIEYRDKENIKEELSDR